MESYERRLWYRDLEKSRKQLYLNTFDTCVDSLICLAMMPFMVLVILSFEFCFTLIKLYDYLNGDYPWEISNVPQPQEREELKSVFIEK